MQEHQYNKMVFKQVTQWKMEHLDRKINIPHKCSCYYYFTTKADKQSEQKCESDIDNNDNNDNDDNDAACGPNDPSAALSRSWIV